MHWGQVFPNDWNVVWEIVIECVFYQVIKWLWKQFQMKMNVWLPFSVWDGMLVHRNLKLPTKSFDYQ